MFIIPVRMKAKYLLIALAVIGVLGIISKQGGIARAHLGGMIWGVLFIFAFCSGRHVVWGRALVGSPEGTLCLRTGPKGGDH